MNGIGSLWTRGARRSMFRYRLSCEGDNAEVLHRIFPTYDMLPGLLDLQDAKEVLCNNCVCRGKPVRIAFELVGYDNPARNECGQLRLL
jgi:hypothetical protein